MHAQKRSTTVALLVVFALLLQSISPSLAAASARQPAVAATMPDLETSTLGAGSEGPVIPALAVGLPDPAQVEHPTLTAVAPSLPQARPVGLGSRRAAQDAAAASPIHLRPAVAADELGRTSAPAPAALENSPGASFAHDAEADAGAWLLGARAMLAALADWLLRAAAAPEGVSQPESTTAGEIRSAPGANESQPAQPVFAGQPALQSGGWVVGTIIGLNCGTEIRVGPGLAVHTIVPEDNWAVMVTGGPRFVDGETWWDTSRAAAGDPAGGTGWVSQQQSEAASCDGGGGGGGPQINWAAGETIGLCAGTEIRHGPGLVVHTVVPEADWLVKITGGPRSYNGQTWWDTSRRDAGDPSGGSGWVSQEQAELACSGGGNLDLFLGPGPLSAALRALFRTYGSDAWRLLGLAGDPVNVTTGALTHSALDFELPGVAGFDLAWERFYHSNDTRAGLFGVGWSSLLDAGLRIANDGTIDVRYADGRGAYFVLDGDDYAPGQAGLFDALTYDDGAKTFTLTTVEQVTFQFTDKGLLTEMRDRHGNTVRFERDGGRITRVVDSGGRLLTLVYEGDRVSAVTDPANRTIRYAYTDGDLTAVTDGNGGVDRFDYVGHRMTRLTDPESITFLQNVYDGVGRIVEQINAAGSHATFAYDEGNRRTLYTDNLGNQTTYGYDDLKRVTSITDALDQSEQFAYDSDDNLVSHTDKRGLTTTFTYDGRGNQLSATNPVGGIRRYTYNSANDVTSYTDELNRVTTYEYDGAGNLVRTVQPDGATISAVYDGRGQMVVQTDANGSTTTYGYDGAGNLLLVTNALQESTESTYDGVGRRTSVRDPNGHPTQFVYDPNGNLVRVVDPKGQATTYRYDGNDSLLEITDRRGGVMRFAYDVNLKLVSEVDAEGHVTRHAYDAMYNRISTTDARGSTTRFQYDALYRLTAVEDALGGVTQTAYDAGDNVIAVRDPLQRTTRFEYDELNRLVKEIDPLDGATTATYDAAGQMLTFTNARLAATRYAYDRKGRVTLVTDAAGGEWRRAYDAAGNLTAATDANGHTTTYGYDAGNRLVVQMDPGGHTTSFAYDGAGNVLAVTDGRGHVTRYAYDENDNLVAVTDALGGVTQIAYDAEDNMVSLTDPAGHATRFAYDLDGQVVQVVDGNGHATAFAYDGAHNRTGVTAANGAVQSFVYDELNRLVQEVDPYGQIAHIAYDAAGQPVRAVAENGVATRTDYDGLGRVVAEVRNERPGLAPDAAVNVTTRSAYDPVGNLIRRVDANGNATTYTCDLLDRLIAEANAAGQVTEYAYDAAGNLVATKNPRGFTTRFVYDPDDLLVQVIDALDQSVQIAYDANHNRTAVTDPHGIVTASEFDALNRLSALTRNFRPGAAADSQTNVTHRYTYHPDGVLATLVDANGNTTTFAYDGVHRLVAEQNALGGVTRYQFDPVGNLVQKSDANGHATTYDHDLLNRLLATTDAEGHSRQLAYDAVGNVVTATNARGFATAMAYDALDRVQAVTDANAGVMAFTYDAAGNVLRFVDQNGHARTFTYDVVDRLLDATDAAGYVTAHAYDANGNRTALTDGNNHQTIYAYDALDRLASTTNAEGETTHYRYDGMDNVTNLVEADGVVTRYVYDPLYRLAGVVLNERPAALPDAGTNVRFTYGYDSNGNLRTLSDPLQHTTRFTYNALNRLTGEVNPIGDAWAYGYDAVGNLTSRRDGNGAETVYSYFADDQLRQVSYPDGTAVLHEYDANHNRVKMTDSLGVSTWRYDELDRLVAANDALQRTMRYAYDPAGNRIQVTYPDSRSVKLAYFANDWLQSMTDPDGGVTSYGRDGVGLPTAVTNPNATQTTFSYDKASRLLTLVNQQMVGARKTLSAFRYTLDDVGQRVRMDAEYGWRQPAQVSTIYTYDPLRRLTRTQDSAGVWTEYTFDAAGNRLALSTNDKAFSPRPFDAQSIQYSYNDANQLLTALSDTVYGAGPKQGRTDKVAQALVAFQHEVSAQAGKHIETAAADSLLAKVGALLGTLYGSRPPAAAATAAAIGELRLLVSTARQSGAIDSDGLQTSLLARLDQAVNANSAPAKSGDLQATTFDYDGNGNRVIKQWAGPQGPAVQGVSYAYSYENLLVQAQEYQGALALTGVRAASDPMAGSNLIFLPVVTALTGEPAALTAAANGVARAITTMHYDGSGRRLVKSYDPKVGAGGVKRTEYAFDLLDPAAEFSLWNGQYSNFYRSDGSDLVSMQTFPSAQKYWYQLDGLGSTAGLSKEQGQSVHNYRYDAYGMVVPVTGNWTEPHNHYAFTGQEWDNETALLHFYARDYDPAVGVWMQQDPYRGRLSEPVTVHRYAYVGENPVNWVDLYGFDRLPGGVGGYLQKSVSRGDSNEYLNLRERYVELFRTLVRQHYICIRGGTACDDEHALRIAVKAIGNEIRKFPSGMPATGNSTSGYDDTRNGLPHNAVDIAGNEGSDIVARHSGVVSDQGILNCAGKTLTLDDGTKVSCKDGGAVYIQITSKPVGTEDTKFVTQYLHLQKDSAIDIGTEVQPGDTIGQMGNTGFSTGSHLHYEIIVEDEQEQVYLDPSDFLGN